MISGIKELSLISSDGFRDDFSGNTLSDDTWDEVLGTGHQISVGSSILQIAPGTNIDTATVIKSKAAYKFPFRLGFMLRCNQRVANQKITIGIVSSTSNDGVQIVLQGNDPNQVQMVSVNGESSAAIAEIRLPKSSTDFEPLIYEIDCLNSEIRAYFRGLYINAGCAESNNIIQRCIPDISQEFNIFVKVENTNPSPVANTLLNLDAIYLNSYASKATVSLPDNPNPTPDPVDDTANSYPSTYNPYMGVSSAIVKNSAGAVQAYRCMNTSDTIRFFQIWDTSTNPGTGTLKISEPVFPGNQLLVIGEEQNGKSGIAFTSGIAFGLSSTADVYTAVPNAECFAGVRFT